MKGFLVRWIINGVALVVAVKVVSGISVADWQTLIIAALVLGLLNAFLRPLLKLLTLPIRMVTLGLFTLVINGILFGLAAWLVDGFDVAGVWSAFFGALVCSVVGGVLGFLLNPDRDR